MGTVTIGRVARNHTSSKMARNFTATHQIMYHSSYLVDPRVPLPHLLLLHLHRRKLWQTRKFQQQEEVKRRARTHQHEETRGMNQQKSKNPKNMTTNNCRVVSCKVCRIVYRVQAWIGWCTCSRTSRCIPFFSWITFGAASKSGTEETQHLYSFPERPELRASCRRRTGTVVPRTENFIDLITADHKVLSEGCGSRHNHRYAVVVHDLATQWIQSYPWEVRRADRETKIHLHWDFLGIWQSLWRMNLESLYVNATQIRNEWDCWESSTQNEERYICGPVAIRSGWKKVGGFHGVLMLSAKHSRSLVWWEDTTWKAVRSTISRPSFSVRSNGRMSPYFC